MATKKFAQMSTKKLQALLETSSEEDVVAIKAVLEARNATANAEAASSKASQELSEEEKAALASAEQAADPEPEAKKPKRKVDNNSTKLNAEELEAAVEEAKKNLYHRCKVSLMGAIPLDGTIMGILKDKRAGYVFYVVQTDATSEIESRKVYKKFGGKEIEVLDEVVEVVKAKKERTAAAGTKKEKMEDEAWDELYKAICSAVEGNIGKTVLVDSELQITGRVVNILRDNRSQGAYYAIKYKNAEGADKTTYKAIKYEQNEQGEIVLDNYLGFAEELDEEGKEVNEKWKNRASRNPFQKANALTLEERILAAEESVKKAEASLLKAQETLAMRKTSLETLKAQLNEKQEADAKALEENADLA